MNFNPFTIVGSIQINKLSHKIKARKHLETRKLFAVDKIFVATQKK